MKDGYKVKKQMADVYPSEAQQWPGIYSRACPLLLSKYPHSAFTSASYYHMDSEQDLLYVPAYVHHSMTVSYSFLVPS